MSYHREQKPTKSTEDLKGPNDLTVEGALEQAKRAFALRNYELSVEHYATALELMHVKLVPDASDAFRSLFYHDSLMRRYLLTVHSTGQNNTVTHLPNVRIYILRMGKHYWRTQLLKTLFSERKKKRPRARKGKRTKVACILQ